MKEFGISQPAMSNFKDDEDTENYIILCMQRKIDDEMDKWKREVESQEKGIQKYEKTVKEKDERFHRSKADIFRWLKVKTK